MHPTVQFSSMVDRRIEIDIHKDIVHPRILVTHWPTATEISWWIRVGEIVDSVTVISGCRWPKAAIFQGISNGLLSGRIWNELVPGKVATGSSFLIVFRCSVVSLTLKDPSRRGVDRKYFSRYLNQCITLDLYSFRNNEIFNYRINEEFSPFDTLNVQFTWIRNILRDWGL